MKKIFLATFAVFVAVVMAAPAFAQYTTADVGDDSTVAQIFNDMHKAVQSLKARPASYSAVALDKAASQFAIAKFLAERKIAEAAVGHPIAAYDLQAARMKKLTIAERKAQAEEFVTVLLNSMMSVEQLKASVGAMSGTNSVRLDSLEARVKAMTDTVTALKSAVAKNTTDIQEGRDLTLDVAHAAGRATDPKANEKVRRTASIWLAGVR